MTRTSAFVLTAAALLFPAVSSAISITPSTSATDLVNTILGPGVTLVGTPTLIGVENQQGIFTNGLGEIGFSSGIVLSSGNVNQIPGPNTNPSETVGGGGTDDDDISTVLGTVGDSDLNALAGNGTDDANVLSFSFQFGDGSVGGDLFFNFVFASEEYLDFVESEYNDVFGFFLDGANIALLSGSPITINNVNNTANSAFYVNNVANTNGIPVAGRNIRFDGLTTVLQASAMGLAPGVHTLSLKIADTADGYLDAGVFVQSGTFSTSPIPPPTPVPEPGTMTLLGLGIAGLFLTRRFLTGRQGSEPRA